MQRRAGACVFLDMKKILAAAFLAASFFVSAASPAVAQQEDSRDLKTQDCARARKLGKQCVLSFEGETIEKGPITADGEGIDVRDITTFSSLIRIRSEFIAEIIRAAEDI